MLNTGVRASARGLMLFMKLQTDTELAGRSRTSLQPGAAAESAYQGLTVALRLCVISRSVLSSVLKLAWYVETR